MNFRTKIFLLLSVVLLCSVMLYVWVYARMNHQRLTEGFEQRAKNAELAFKADQDSTQLRMLQIATVVAHDQKVQQLFLLGKKAVEMEGGGAGGNLSAQVRQSLFEHVQESQKVLAEEFGFRQLHFHLGPGSLSFLRVHRPEKFGDRMDKVRYTVVATNGEQKSTMGFETGRVFSGIRGVTPVYAFDGSTKKKVHVGALEAGTSFASMLSLFHKNLPWLDAAVLLSREHLQANVWPDFLDKLTTEHHFVKGFRVEGRTSAKIDKFLIRNDFAKVLQSPGHYLLRDGEIHYSITSFPLRDFLGEKDPAQPDAGLIILWRDASIEMAAYHNNVRNLIFYGLALFVLIEFLMYYGLMLMTKGLQVELEQTREHEAASDNARLVAEESSRLKTEFLSNMSHELRTPMNAIMGLGQLLSETPLDNRQQDFINKINLSSQLLLSLINEVLQVAEVDEQEREELSCESYCPTQLLNGVVEKFAVQAKKQGLTLKVDISAGAPSRVNGRPAQLEQILSQLLGNAVKFSHDGEVILSLKLLDQNVDKTTLEYAVTDQGIGISTEQQGLIFQPFQQGDGSKTRAYGGAGLGLTIAQKICRRLGGNIAVESDLGQGSRFSFQLKYQTLAEDSDSPAIATTAVVKTEHDVVQVMGTISEIDQLLQQFEGPLAKMQPKPCQDIANELKAKQWPENLRADIEELTSLIAKYRFAEAREAADRLKGLIS